jgi:integrase
VTICLYLGAVRNYFEFLDEQELAPQINTRRLARQLRKRMPRSGRRLPQFPREEIEKLLEYAEGLVGAPAEDENERLMNLRDRALILLLADTGLRVHEAYGLKPKDVDWHEGRRSSFAKEISEGTKWIVEIKWRGRRVGVKEVEKLAGLAREFGAQAWLISRSGFTEAAVEVGMINRVFLSDRNGFRELQRMLA